MLASLPMSTSSNSQLVELQGRYWLTAELLRAGLEVALPVRDRGIDLIAYADLGSATPQYVSRPIQLKAASERSFAVDQKYGKFAPGLLIAYVWWLGDPQRTMSYALTYDEAVGVAERMGWVETKSWQVGSYSTTRPSANLLSLLKPFAMTPAEWWEKVTRPPFPAAAGSSSSKQ